MATPRVHVRDVFVTTDLDAAYRDAELRVDGRARQLPRGGGLGAPSPRHPLRRRRRARAGALRERAVAVAAGGTTNGPPRGARRAPRLWSAENPHLYRLVLEPLGPDGEVVEILGVRVGFREVEVRGQALLVNGRAVKLNAVNSHMHHPDTGRAMDVATMREDLVLMKRFGVNAVRTSHYPPNVEYLDLADELGVYVIDEAGTEAHATEFLSERPEWREAYVERGRKMVLRDRNHPSDRPVERGQRERLGGQHLRGHRRGEAARPEPPGLDVRRQQRLLPRERPARLRGRRGPALPDPLRARDPDRAGAGVGRPAAVLHGRVRGRDRQQPGRPRRVLGGDPRPPAHDRGRGVGLGEPGDPGDLAW